MMANFEDDAISASEFDEAYDDPRELRGAILSEPLSQVPRRPAVIVEATATIAEAITKMNERSVGCALVMHGSKLAGIFTERDVLRRVLGKGLDAQSASIEGVMTTNPDVLPESAGVAHALQKMNVEGYRHIPLVDAHGAVVGVIGVRDIVAWMCGLFPESAMLNLSPRPGTFPKAADGG